jgi:hypothetical protein
MRGWVSKSRTVSDTERKPDRRSGRRQASKEASWVKEWRVEGRPKGVRRRDALLGRVDVHGTVRRMSSREAVRVE